MLSAIIPKVQMIYLHCVCAHTASRREMGSGLAVLVKDNNGHRKIKCNNPKDRQNSHGLLNKAFTLIRIYTVDQIT